MVDQVVLEQVFSDYFGFLANLHSTIIYHLGLAQQVTGAAAPSGLSLTPLRVMKEI
jgi:hypothetical protein